jgi:hypothetical protein
MNVQADVRIGRACTFINGGYMEERDIDVVWKAATRLLPEWISCGYMFPHTIKSLDFYVYVERPSKIMRLFSAIVRDNTATQRIGSFAVDITLRMPLLSDNTAKLANTKYSPDLEEMKTIGN